MSDTRPNILIITTHDTGRHFACYGAAGVESPSIDRLAAEGVRFDSCFTACPVCSPSRGAMMTGRYPQSNGLMGLTHQPWWWDLNDEEQHLSNILHDAGYSTYLFGIQHETPSLGRLGFDATISRQKAEGGGKNAPEIAEDVVEALRGLARSNKPFYAQIGFFETHTDYGFGGAVPGDPDNVAVPPFIKDNEAARLHLAALAGAVKQADRAVGRILDGLKETGLEDNTIVIFTVDHGVELGRRAKWTCYDAGIEIALLMRWPEGGISGGRVIGELVSNVDVLPTLMELIGEKIPKNLEGRSFKDMFDDSGDNFRYAVYAMFRGQCEPRCIRTKRFKLIRNFEASRPLKLPVDISHSSTEWQPRPFVELYDLEADPYELNNVADDPAYQDTRQQLDARLWQWLEQVSDPILSGPIPTPYYIQAVDDLMDR